ncbi:hypothetical protein RB195_019431 [Necator americanus]
MHGSETWAAPSTVIERLDCTERRLLRWLPGSFWPRICHYENLYAEIDVVYRWMTRGRYQHLAPPSKLAIEASSTSSEFAGFELKEATWPEDLKFWTEVVKEDLRTSGVDRQFRRDVRFRRIWNRDEWIDSVQALAEDREGWAELCSRTAHLGEDAGNSVRDEISPPIK